MIRPLAIACAVAVFAALPAPANARPRGEVHGLALPPGTRVDQSERDRYISSRTFRRTVDWYQRHLRRRGLNHHLEPIYRYRGTVVARIHSREPSATWSALHIYQSAGKTYIYVVPATPLTSRRHHCNEGALSSFRDRLTAGPVTLDHVI